MCTQYFYNKTYQNYFESLVGVYMASERDKKFNQFCKLADSFKGGVIMDVTNVEEAKIAQGFEVKGSGASVLYLSIYLALGKEGFHCW